MTKIAIIGLSCLFPGADSPAAFWEALADGRDTTSDATHAELGVDPSVFNDPTQTRADTSYFLHGGYVREFAFDPHGYRIPADIIQPMDRMVHWSLHVARGALSDSGYLNRQSLLDRTGIILGNLSFPTQHSNRLFVPVYDAIISAALAERLDVDTLDLPATGDSVPVSDGLSPGYPAAVVASALGLAGPHFALDAACAASIYALEMACLYLRAGKVDLMLAGAVSAADPLFVNLGFAHLGGYPQPGQRSRPLDAQSGGLVAGEGAGMFVLKRYDDAMRDGDHIYAVIGGVGLSNDGRGKHVLTPNSKGQLLAIQRAFAEGGLRPEQVDYIECHASGTPLGDSTELNSLEQFFGSGHRPRIGSVKSNLGHLLTAAGMASMTKLILSMAQGKLPATINNHTPLTSLNGTFDGSQIVTELTDWPHSNRHPRRAGINAFGFGGVSAHVILEANESQIVTNSQTTGSSRSTPNTKLAITGMGAYFGRFSGIDALARAIYDGDTAFVPLPEHRWKGLQHHPDLLRVFGLQDGRAPDGAYIGSFELDFMKYGIPPNPDEEPIPQQLLLLEVADQAIRDAELPRGSNVAVLVALGTELALHQVRGRADLNWKVEEALAQSGITLNPEQAAALEHITKDALLSPAQVNHYTSYIGNLAASRVAALWDFNGPAFTISAEENSVFKAVEVASLLLGEGKVDAVVVGAVDMAGSFESMLLRNGLAPMHQGAPAAGIDASANGWMIGEGAGALVLKRAESADPAQTYATIDALAFARENAAALPDAPDAQTVQKAAHDALAAANIASSQVGYVEMHASGIDREDQAEIAGLTTVFAGTDDQTAIGTVKANIGHTFAASGMASLIKTALCLDRRIIPAIPNWNAPEQPSLWQGTGLWVAHQSRAWLDPQPIAMVSSLGSDGTAGTMILSRPQTPMRDHDYRRTGAPYLFPLSGDGADDLTRQLERLYNVVNNDTDLESLARDVYAEYAANARYAVAIVGRSHDEIRKQVEAAMTGVPDALRTGGTWTTPLGSAFTAAPVGQQGHAAFVYPGAFNSYPRLGYDLFQLFPTLYDSLQQVKPNVGDALREDLLYPRTLEKPGPKTTRQMKEALANDPVAMSETGLAFALLYSRIMQDIFGVQPGAAFGYSLGEGSMMWGMGVWNDGEAGSMALRQSPLFRKRIAGRMEAIREAWGIAADVPVESFWAAHFIAAPVEQVQRAVARENRVYLTHINTPNEVMIAGDPDGCQRVVDVVGGESMRAPFAVAIHAPVMMSEFNEFRHLHDLPVTQVKNVRFYSAADYEPLPLDRTVIATSIARMACNAVDFPRLVERAYDDGARVFIELGPRSTCARWIDETLADRPHVAVSIDNMSTDDRTSIVRMLAQLVSHRVPMDLSAMFPLPKPAVQGRSLIRKVRLGGADIYAAIVNADAQTAVVEHEPAYAHVPTARAAFNPPLAKLPTALPDELSRVHGDFLNVRQHGLRQMGDLIRAQMDAITSGSMPAHTPERVPEPEVEFVEEAAPLKPPPAPSPAPPPSQVKGITPMYNHEKVATFATGRVADAYGERYTIYDDRRAPRIPNGPLLLVTRAVDISGERFQSKPGTEIHAEYDVPEDAWFYEENAYPTMPYSVYMEIALQPSGFLSAHHGPTLAFPDIDFYFRNLDGYGVLHHDRDMRGRTITNYVKLTNSTIMSDTIIQSFSFRMYDGDLLFYEGEATFGYFTKAALSSQAGLDAGRQVLRWIDTIDPADYRIVEIDPHQPLGSGYLRLTDPDSKLTLTDVIKVVPDGGMHGKGYAYAHTIINPDDWFFKAHFYQDPVMPGSIGVETIMQALQAYAIETGLGSDMESPHFAQVDGSHRTTWRYRGQILSDSEKSHIEAHIKEIKHEPGKITIYADASLWRDMLRIYHVTDIALSIVEG